MFPVQTAAVIEGGDQIMSTVLYDHSVFCQVNGGMGGWSDSFGGT